ncbi:MAG: hypothetical protein LC798_01955 [Chloroflexi bacterium]|nr:hypothetical protein [Chloroflexota bacterium]
MFRGLLLMLCALALTAPAAAAAEDEVFVDPGSPSGKEYALPVDSARKQAAGDARNKSSNSQATPLFGEGVDRDAGSAGGGSGSGESDAGGGSGRGGASGDGGGEASSPQRADPEGGTPVTARAQAASPDGGSGTIAIIGAGAGVLLLGGAIGLVLRRRAARTT